jgi:PhzF family phenazine biosynthesis protein
MKLPVYQIDAFASRVFAGNPAVVCLLDGWLEDTVLTAIAAEHNISTTAFLVDGAEGFEIRYFAGAGEFALLGHASLAAAHVVLRLLRPEIPRATLRRRNGLLEVSRLDEELLAIQLPAAVAEPCAAPAGLEAALRADFIEVRATEAQYFVVMKDEAAVASVAPDMERLMGLDRDAVIVTAPGNRCAFVSRAFVPKEGLPEDPVCGSAHLALVPFWSDRCSRRSICAAALAAGWRAALLLAEGRGPVCRPMRPLYGGLDPHLRGVRRSARRPRDRHAAAGRPSTAPSLAEPGWARRRGRGAPRRDPVRERR